MRKVIRGIPKKTIEYILQLFSPTMDDYPYVLDLKEDSYLISYTAVQRFRLPADHFIHSREINTPAVCISGGSAGFVGRSGPDPVR